MEISNRIVQLLKQHISQTLDAAGHAELTAWADSAPAYRQLLDEVTDEAALKAALLDFHAVYGPDESAAIQRMERRIEAGIGLEQAANPGSRVIARTLKWLPYAAAILFVASVVGYFAVGDRWLGDGGRELVTTEILPGGNRATLTLADGRTINLDEAQTGITVSAEDITYDDGTSVEAVMVSGVEPSLPNPGDAPAMLSLTTPKGGTYQITLPDGSKVWLNSASTLKYPNRFPGNERVVEIVGEGYFEIEQDAKRPFKVRSGGQEIEVLGTQFNISAYADDAEIQTTLVEGSVQIRHPERGNGVGKAGSRRISANENIVILKPGQQATSRGMQTEIRKVEVDQYTSWKSGRFSFENKSFDQVFRELARWYDIDIRYEGPMPDVEFYGGAFRNKNLNVVLRLLESAKLSYRMDGRTLVIHTKEEVNK